MLIVKTRIITHKKDVFTGFYIKRINVKEKPYGSDDAFTVSVSN